MSVFKKYCGNHSKKIFFTGIFMILLLGGFSLLSVDFYAYATILPLPPDYEFPIITIPDFGDGPIIIIPDPNSSASTSDESSSSKEVGSSNQHNTRPTFGLDHSSNIKLVDDGFTFNENSFDITGNFWTPFEIQTINIGEQNTFSAKVYVDKQLQIQEFLFGIPALGEAHNAELGIEVYYNSAGSIINVNMVQKTDIIDADSIVVTHNKSLCTPLDTIERCDTTTISMKFLEPLKDDVMAIKAIDFKGRNQITYLNDGFDISGDSLNPMNIKMIPGPEKYEGLIKVTKIEKYSNYWIAQDGRIFESNDSEHFEILYLPSAQRDDPNNTVMNRMHSNFAELKQYEIDMAITILDKLCSSCNDEHFGEIFNTFAYEYPALTLRSDNSELQKLLVSENLRAQKILDDIYTSYYPSMVFD